MNMNNSRCVIDPFLDSAESLQHLKDCSQLSGACPLVGRAWHKYIKCMLWESVKKSE